MVVLLSNAENYACSNDARNDPGNYVGSTDYGTALFTDA
jgi:hypothetical protein